MFGTCATAWRDVLGQDRRNRGEQELYTNPLQPYTQALLSAVPVPDPRSRSDASASSSRVTCPARSTRRRAATSTPRPVSVDVCFDTDPELVEVLPGHWVACHRVIYRRIRKLSRPRRLPTPGGLIWIDLRRA